MATTGLPKRSSRLASRNPPIKAVPERKLRIRKVISTNENPQKVNVIVRKKKLREPVRKVSINNSRSFSKRLRPRKSKNYRDDIKLLQLHISPKQQNSLVILEKLDDKIPVYKMMKPEKSVEDKDDVYDFKFDINDPKEKVTKKKRKKRNINRIAKDGETVRQILTEQNTAIKKPVRKKVAKQLKTMDNEANKPPELDTNLSAVTTQHNAPSGSTAKIVTRSRKKDVTKSEMPRIDTDSKAIKRSVKNDIKKSEIPRINVDAQRVEEPVKDVAENIETLEINTDTQIAKENIVEVETSKRDTNIETAGDATSSDGTLAQQSKEQDATKPRIISIENADNIVIIDESSSISNTKDNNKDLQPFRPKNIFDNKTSIKESKNALSCTLLTKSLSPISKMTNAFDSASPWRSPMLPTFSLNKYFFQSTPNISAKKNKENMEIGEQKKRTNKENVKMDKENMENMNIENVDMNKENKHKKLKEKKKKEVSFYRKHIVPRKLPTNQAPEKLQATCPTKPVAQPAPARVSLGEIKNLLQTKDTNKDSKQTKPDINEDNKQTAHETHVEAGTSVMQKKNNPVDIVNFSDTFDVLSETQRQSNLEAEVPLFMDLEPSHFSEPPQRSYKRRRVVKFFTAESDEESEEKKNDKPRTKKKKVTKLEKEREKEINKWINSINSTFEEIDKYNLLIE